MFRLSVGPTERLYWLGPGDPIRMTAAYELLWERPPDEERLRAAVAALPRRFPLLDCRLVARRVRCRWEGPTGEPPERVLVRRDLPAARSGEDEPSRRERLRAELLMEPLRPERGELWRIFRVALPDGGEWWLVPIHEIVADGRGWGEVIDQLLTYLREPPADVRPDARPRDLGPLPPRNLRAARRAAAGQPRGLSSPWPAIDAPVRRRYETLQFPPPVAAQLRERARALGATANDLILALIARALASSGGFACHRGDEEWLRLCFLIDLRRLTQHPTGLGNFLGVGAVSWRNPLPEDLSSAVATTAAQTRAALDPSLLAAQARLVRWTRRVPVSWLARLNRRMFLRPGAVSATVTSLGEVERHLPAARDLPIAHAGAVGFLHPSVPCVLVISSFRGALTMAGGFAEDLFDAARRDDVLGRIRRGILEAAAPALRSVGAGGESR